MRQRVDRMTRVRERNVQLADLFGLLALDHVGDSLAADVTVGAEWKTSCQYTRE